MQTADLIGQPGQPGPPARDGRPRKERLRWSVEWACREFAINPRTLANRLTTQGIDPDPDGYYSTGKIAAAVFGDLDGERIRETRSKADLNELELAVKRGKLVDRDEIVRLWQDRFIAMARIVKSSKLSEDEQIAMQAELAAVLKG